MPSTVVRGVIAKPSQQPGVSSMSLQNSLRCRLDSDLSSTSSSKMLNRGNIRRTILPPPTDWSRSKSLDDGSRRRFTARPMVQVQVVGPSTILRVTPKVSRFYPFDANSPTAVAFPRVTIARLPKDAADLTRPQGWVIRANNGY